MKTIKENVYYKTDSFIDVNGKIFRNKIFKIDKGKIRFYKKSKENVIELKESVVFPSPVNAHTHLELTDIDKSQLDFTSFVDWVISLIKIKGTKNEDFLLNSYFNGKKLLKKYGTNLFGNFLSPLLYTKIPEQDKIFNFVEIIEYNRENISKVNLNYIKIAPHAFFSVHPELIEKILNLAKPVSMHFFESFDEYDYLLEQKGGIIEKLYPFVGLSPLKYGIDYFIKFLIKVKNIQLIHLSNIPKELEPIIIEKKDDIFFTLCPRSNEMLGYKSPYHFFIKNNIPFSLGTDSLCSNKDLNVLNEARYIYEDLKDFFNKEKIAAYLFFSLTKWGYNSIFLKNREYSFIDNVYVDKNFQLTDFMEHLLHMKG
jgi:cytosine/adenosine deaminase-related metal-dependent hydrolase